MNIHYEGVFAYDADMVPCPECGGRMVLAVGEVPMPWCTECETAFVPDVPELVAKWWNEGASDL